MELNEKQMALFLQMLPWVTGGLAGAIFTFVTGRYLASRTQLRMSLARTLREFTLPPTIGKKNLRISYDNTVHERLAFSEVAIGNTGSRFIADVEFVLTLSEEAEIIDQTQESEPVQIPIHVSREDSKKNQFRVVVPELRSGDVVRLGFLVDGPHSIDFLYRGKENAKITERTGVTPSAFESDMRLLVLIVALILTLNAVPFFGGAFQGMFLIVTSPFVVGIISRRIEEFRAQRDEAILRIAKRSTGNAAMSHNFRLTRYAQLRA